jgi:hypothetical protein
MVQYSCGRVFYKLLFLPVAPNEEVNLENRLYIEQPIYLMQLVHGLFITIMI